MTDGRTSISFYCCALEDLHPFYGQEYTKTLINNFISYVLCTITCPPCFTLRSWPVFLTSPWLNLHLPDLAAQGARGSDIRLGLSLHLAISDLPGSPSTPCPELFFISLPSLPLRFRLLRSRPPPSPVLLPQAFLTW